MNPIADYQCGFKAMNSKRFRKIAHHIKNDNWFFDTELLLLAERKRMRIKQIDVHWTDDGDSRFNLGYGMIEFTPSLMRVRLSFWKESLRNILNEYF